MGIFFWQDAGGVIKKYRLEQRAIKLLAARDGYL
jgi:hypothetical protein